MDIELNVSEVFEWNYNVLDLLEDGSYIRDCDRASLYDENDALQAEFKYRFVFNRGSSRSTKTYSLLQLFYLKCLEEPNIVVEVFRKTLTACLSSVGNEFINMLVNNGVYDINCHNKSKNFYQFPNGSIIQFKGADDPQKLRGLSRTYAYLNECNELFMDDVAQIEFRTERQIFCDYNPSETDSWVYEYEDYGNSIMFKSTFKNNPFLSKEHIKSILSFKDKDPELWSIFGLGERVTSRVNVFNHFQFVDQRPVNFKDDNYVFGMDWGFNDPTAMVKVYYDEDEIYVEEVLYQTHMHINDIIEFMEGNDISKSKEIIVDYARPENTSVLQQNGYNCHNGNKAIKAGIDNIKSKKVYVNSKSVNVIKEYNNYKWKKKGDNILDETIDLWNHSMDALRYATRYIDMNFKSSKEPRFKIRRY